MGVGALEVFVGVGMGVGGLLVFVGVGDGASTGEGEDNELQAATRADRRTKITSNFLIVALLLSSRERLLTGVGS